MLKSKLDCTAKFSLVIIAMPPKKAEEKLSELLEEQLRPIKEAIKDLITNGAMAKHIDLLETKLVRKINEQAAEIARGGALLKKEVGGPRRKSTFDTLRNTNTNTD